VEIFGRVWKTYPQINKRKPAQCAGLSAEETTAVYMLRAKQIDVFWVMLWLPFSDWGKIVFPQVTQISIERFLGF
jgi:hypothetical protein